MNRLVIIGNGFDLAHGLPTGYRSFIDDFWQNFREKLKTEEYKKFVYSHDGFVKYYTDYGQINSFVDFKNSIKENISEYPEFVFDEHQLIYYTSKFGNREKIFAFKNDFFKIINQRNVENWVDIENEYYKLLKKNLDSKPEIEKLNSEFEDIKSLLHDYLIERVEQRFDFSNLTNNEFFKIIESNLYEGDDLNRFYLELPKKDVNQLEKEFKEKNAFRSKDFKKKLKLQNYFLSFNYTSTVAEYNKQLNLSTISLNEIHGRLGNERNPINFGFGDEMDRQYQQIEEIDDNEYLRNIKSFQYLHTPNYKQLLDLIDSEYFQIYIMGHSCGLSDRTLLNTIFEHENCRSIKIYYHEKEDGTDNYTEITQNISRHFNKKKLMREKIVNRTFCYPLPQIQLPQKK